MNIGIGKTSMKYVNEVVIPNEERDLRQFSVWQKLPEQLKIESRFDSHCGQFPVIVSRR